VNATQSELDEAGRGALGEIFAAANESCSGSALSPHQLARATTVSPISFDQSLVLRAQVHLSIVLIAHTRLCALSIKCLQGATVMAVACLRAAEQWCVAGRGQFGHVILPFST
jgi:hypothetical protein